MRTNAKVYVMRSPEGALNLGHSVDPARRSRQLGRDIAVVHETEILEHAEIVERLAHRVMALHGRHVRGEWFDGDLADVIRAIDIAVRQADGGRPVSGRAMLRRLNVRVPRAVAGAIALVQRDRKDGAGTAQVVRELLVEALKARGKL